MKDTVKDAGLQSYIHLSDSIRIINMTFTIRTSDRYTFIGPFQLLDVAETRPHVKVRPKPGPQRRWRRWLHRTTLNRIRM